MVTIIIGYLDDVDYLSLDEEKLGESEILGDLSII